MSDEGPELVLGDRDLEELPEDICRRRGPHVTTLNLDSNRLRSFAHLEHFTALETLILDKNGLSSLEGCPAIPSLQTLWFNNNQVSDMVTFLDQVVERFPRLEYLSIMRNPASPPMLCMSEEDIRTQERHRLYVIYRLPSLSFLDSAPVSAEERAEAAAKGRFLAVRRAQPRQAAAAAPAAVTAPTSTDPTPFAAGGGGEAAEEAQAVQRRGAYFGRGTTHFESKHSEGNRFIVNDDL